MDELLTGPEAANLVGVKTATIRQWRHRGLLEPTGLDDRGHPLYRQLDVARAEKHTRARARRTVQRAA